MFFVELEHGVEVDIADDVDVVEEERLVEASGIFEEKPGGFFQAAAGVQELVVFAREFDAEAEIIFGLEIVEDHPRKVVDVDDEFRDAEMGQTNGGDFQEGAAVDFDESFGARVG